MGSKKHRSFHQMFSSARNSILGYERSLQILAVVFIATNDTLLVTGVMWHIIVGAKALSAKKARREFCLNRCPLGVQKGQVVTFCHLLLYTVHLVNNALKQNLQ